MSKIPSPRVPLLSLWSAEAAVSIVEAGSGSRRRGRWLSSGMERARRRPAKYAERALFWCSFVTAKFEIGTRLCAKIVLDPVSRVESDGGLRFGSILNPEAVG